MKCLHENLQLNNSHVDRNDIFSTRQVVKLCQNLVVKAFELVKHTAMAFHRFILIIPGNKSNLYKGTRPNKMHPSEPTFSFAGSSVSRQS